MSRRNGHPPAWPPEAEIRAEAHKYAIGEGPGDEQSPLEARFEVVARYHARQIEFHRAAQASQALRAFQAADRSRPDKRTLTGRFERHYTGYRQRQSASERGIARAVFAEYAEGRQFEAFRRTHKLTRHARYATNPFLYWFAPAALAFGFETLVNVCLFASYLASGAVAALGLSGGVSFVSASAAVAGAGLSRNLTHRSPGRRLIGAAGVAVLASFLVLLHLCYAHLRTLVQHSTSVSVGPIIQRVFSPAIFDVNIQGALLFFVGVAAACAIWHRAFVASDPYCGYAAQDRALRSAVETADLSRASLTNLRAKLLAAARDDLTDLVEAGERAITNMKRAVERFDAIEASSALRLGAVEEQWAEALAIFWDENAAPRKTPLPPRASVAPKLKLCATAPDTDELHQRLRQAATDFEDLQDHGFLLLKGFDRYMETEGQRLLSEIDIAARTLRELPTRPPDDGPTAPLAVPS